MTVTERSAPASANRYTLLDLLGAYLNKDELGRIVAEAKSPRRKIDPDNITLLCRTLESAAIEGRYPHTQQDVPKRILQYWDQKEVPADVAACMETWKIPGFDHVIFDEEQAREFLRTEYDVSHLEAYDLCSHPAMKSDLFRLAYLYRYGGVYVDSDDSYQGANFGRLIANGLFQLRTIGLRKIRAQSLTPIERRFLEGDRIQFNNNPIFCVAKDEILLRALERATRTIRVRGRTETHRIIKVTGPTNLSVAVYTVALDCIVSGSEFTFCPIIDWDNIASTNTELAYQKTNRNWRRYERSSAATHDGIGKPDQSRQFGESYGATSARSDVPERHARLCQVTDRLAKDELGFASLAYLKLRYLKDVALGKVSGRLPYGADPDSRCLFYSVHEDPAALLHHAFLYEAQFNAVQTVVAVPFEQLHDVDRTARPPATFVFSIGRCGSTLLVRMLGAAGLTAISEPDIFTQMARPEAQRFSLQDQRECIAAATRCLAGYSPKAVVIKLRSRCTIIAPLIISSVRGSRCEFILRNRRDWAKSMFTVGPFEPAALARQLRASIIALDWLVDFGYCAGPIWYEDIVRDPTTILRRFPANLAPERNAELLKAVTQDSQSGTSLAQENLSQRAVSDELLNRFEDEWRNIRPEILLGKHGLKERL